ncbi:hypothetical protein ACJIZ3_003668 [Penstemon smallii]|uniref:DUF4216 domain-containing protein n=1 Tax=Penstemon smallii TaxID=265156 RepID=A0ABD3UCZ3_9LAMI
MLNKPSRNNDDGSIKEGVLHIFSNPGRPLGKGLVKVLDDNTLTKAHRYVLFNCQVVEPYKVEHLGMISQQYPNLRDWDKEKIHNEQFPRWFKDREVSLLDLVENPFREELKVLAQGPQKVFTRYKKYIINGFRFHTKEIEARRRTQNSGVIVTAETISFSSRKDTNPIVSDVTYYGILTDIVELDYLFGKRVVLFKCDWVSQRGKRSEKDCVLVNFSYLMGDEEPFILASQAMQVMYVKDLKHKDWHIAIRIVPRDFFDMTSRSSTDDVDNYLQSVVLNTIDPEDSNNSTLVRTDVPPVIVDTPQPQASNQGDTEVGDNNIEEEEDLLC